MTRPDPHPPEQERPSKTRRKRDMHELQSLGESLVALRGDRLAALALPENLFEAVIEAQRITSREGRRRQLQYVGRLMREVDAAPIRAQLRAWQHDASVHTRQHHEVERWRERLLAEPQALDDLLTLRPALDAASLRTLVGDARRERADGAPPRRYRELFRTLKGALEGG
jgi:ribosome-associated protein